MSKHYSQLQPEMRVGVCLYRGTNVKDCMVRLSVIHVTR